YGVCYMLMIFPRSPDLDREYSSRTIVDQSLLDLEHWLPSWAREDYLDRPGVAAANARVLKTLEQPIPMHFPHETPLEEVLKYIIATARCEDGRALPIYVNPVGLQEAEKTSVSPVVIDLEDLPLNTTLRLALEQLGLVYFVKDGLLQIVGARYE